MHTTVLVEGHSDVATRLHAEGERGGGEPAPLRALFAHLGLRPAG